MSLDTENSSLSPVPRDLVVFLRERFAIDWNGAHGGSHWSRVRINGLQLAKLTGADSVIVEFFAFLHDSCRKNEYDDPGHGARAAELVWRLPQEMLPLSDSQRDILAEACRGHTGGEAHSNATVATCWDADRLDLYRVGIETDADRLITTFARTQQIMDGARDRALSWLEKRHSSR